MIIPTSLFFWRQYQFQHTLTGSLFYITERAMSPELSRDVENRAKLRRSRSACDLNEVRKFKRIEPTLPPISSKPTRIGNTTASTLASGSNSTALSTKRIISLKSSTVRTAATCNAGNKKLNNNASAPIPATKTAAAKPIIKKKIPSYDFKGRFHELQEKHNILKEKFDANRNELDRLDNISDQLDESEAELSSTKDKLRETQTQFDALERQVKSQEIKIESLTNCLEKTKVEFEKLKEDHSVSL